MKILPGNFNINCPRVLIVDLTKNTRRQCTVKPWAHNKEYLEAVDENGKTLHFHAQTAKDIYRGQMALVNWSNV